MIAADAIALDMITAQLVLLELQRRIADIPDVVDHSFPHQAEFILTNDRWLALFGTRRMSKTESLCRRFLRTGFTRARAPMLYISLTKDQARRIFWDGTLKPVLERLGLMDRMDLHEQRMECRFPTGAILYTLGMDADERQMNKLLGGKYAGVGIDEAGSFKVNLKTMYTGKIRPALIDLGGWLCLAGTPEDFAAGLFFEITRDDETPRLKGWSVHEWTGFENPYVSAKWAQEIDELKADNPEVERTPEFQRNYLKRWVKDKTKLCYRPKESTFIKDLPPGDYYYGLGVDLGYEDATAFNVLAVKEGTRKAYVVYQYKQSGMILHDIDAHIRMLQKLFFFMYHIIDGANKQAVETMKEYFEIPFESAEKAGKAEMISLINSSIIMDDFFVVGAEPTNLELEWRDLIWDEEELPKKVEDSRCENHQSDANLYIWRKMISMFYQDSKEREKPPAKTDEEKHDAWIERKSLKVKLKKKKRRFGAVDDDEGDDDDFGGYDEEQGYGYG